MSQNPGLPLFSPEKFYEHANFLPLTIFLKPPSFARKSCPDCRCPWRHKSLSFRFPILAINYSLSLSFAINYYQTTIPFFCLFKGSPVSSPQQISPAGCSSGSAETQTGSAKVQIKIFWGSENKFELKPSTSNQCKCSEWNMSRLNVTYLASIFESCLEW